MEGPMDWPITKRYREANYDILDYGREPTLEFDRAPPDAAGYWFLAVVLFAFLAAGVIAYRSGHGAVQPQTVASYSSHPAAQTDPIGPPPLLQPR
jgi:hypothetical protein